MKLPLRTSGRKPPASSRLIATAQLLLPNRISCHADIPCYASNTDKDTQKRNRVSRALHIRLTTRVFSISRHSKGGCRGCRALPVILPSCGDQLSQYTFGALQGSIQTLITPWYHPLARGSPHWQFINVGASPYCVMKFPFE